MKTILSALIASVFIIGSASAQTSAPNAPTKHVAETTKPSPAKSEDRPGHDVEKHIADLHAKLKITPAQESQWSDVAQTMRSNAGEMEEAIEKREANATAIDDLNAYAGIVQAHADGIKKLAKSFSSLYAAMPDDQKKLADEVFVHGGRAHEHAGKEAASKH